ncbi:MAG TPA: sugar nucleotide-binding protein [Solirubrobacteraceae bacterium]
MWLSGASGFVGCNVTRVFERHGADVRGPARAEVDVTDAHAVLRDVEAFAPDAIVHCAILNDPAGLLRARRAAWEGYVGATRNVVDAANAVDAHLVLVSTDWVFDGTQAGATEDEPPNPINAYGFLKAASEIVVRERAQRGAVARIAGVNGVHWARVGGDGFPRAQDAGFGYLVASVVAALRAGLPFTVWESPVINEIATPTLASDAAELMWRLVERGPTGIFHCCGGESVHRVELARRAVAAFDLDGELLRTGPPDPAVLEGGPVPHDTSLDARATAAALGVELPGVDAMLARLREELAVAAPPPALALGTEPPGGGTPWV